MVSTAKLNSRTVPTADSPALGAAVQTNDPTLTTRTIQGRRALARRGLDRLTLDGYRSTMWAIKSATLDRFAFLTLDPSRTLQDPVDWLLSLVEGQVRRSAVYRFQERFRAACHAEIQGRPLSLGSEQRSPDPKSAARKRQARTSKQR